MLWPPSPLLGTPHTRDAVVTSCPSVSWLRVAPWGDAMAVPDLSLSYWAGVCTRPSCSTSFLPCQMRGGTEVWEMLSSVLPPAKRECLTAWLLHEVIFSLLEISGCDRNSA